MKGRVGASFLPAALVLAAALAVRAPLVTPTLPYLGYVDEGHVLHRVVTLLRTGGWDPGWYLHPSLTAYAVTFAVRAAEPFYRLAHGHALSTDLPAPNDFYDVVTPAVVILAGRLVVLAASLGIVALGILLARRLAGPRAGVAAGLLLAFFPALVQRSTVTNVDVVATLCVLGTLVLVQRLDSALAAGEPAPAARRAALLAGLLAGLAAAAKYPSGAVFGAVVATLVARPGSLRERLRLATAATAGAAAGAFAGMPAFLFRSREVLAAMQEQSRLYGDPSLFTPGGSGPSLFAQAFYRYEMGLLLPVAGLAGLAVLAVRKETRAVAAGWLAFAAVLLLPALLHAFQPFRYALPLVPLFAVGTAVLLVRAMERLARRSAAALAAAVAAVVLSFAPGLVMAFQVRGSRDSRVRLVDWLAGSTRPGQRILVVKELAILPGELARIPAETRAVPWNEARALAEAGGFDWLVFGRFDVAGALPSQDKRAFEGIVPWEEWLARLSVAREFGSVPTPVTPFFWRSNDELLRVAPLARAAP